jgi:hypothetical protein
MTPPVRLIPRNDDARSELDLGAICVPGGAFG